MVSTGPQKQAQALVAGHSEVIGRSQLDYTNLAGQEEEDHKLTFRGLQKVVFVSVPEHRRVAAGTQAAPETIGIAHGCTCSGVQHQV